jgi:hypothetical protein
MKITQLLAQYEQFVRALQSVRGFDVSTRPMSPSSAEDISALERLLGVTVPEDLRAFWAGPFTNVSVCDADGEVVIADTFVDAKGSLSAANVALSVLASVSSLPEEEKAWLKGGIPLHEDEDYCFVFAGEGGDGAVHLMVNDGETPRNVIAASFTDYFEQYLAAGCYCHGNADSTVFRRYWAEVEKLVPVKVAPTENRWLRTMALQYQNESFPD